MSHAVRDHPVGDLRLGDGVGDDAQGVPPAVQLDDGGLHIVPGDPAAVMVPPEPGEPPRVGADSLGVVVGQQMLAPQLHLPRVDQGLLDLAAVLFPALLQLLKEYVVGLRGADQLHQLLLRGVGKRLVGDHDAQGVAHIEENRIRHLFRLLMIICICQAFGPFIPDRMGTSSGSSWIT